MTESKIVKRRVILLTREDLNVSEEDLTDEVIRYPQLHNLKISPEDYVLAEIIMYVYIHENESHTVLIKNRWGNKGILIS